MNITFKQWVTKKVPRNDAASESQPETINTTDKDEVQCTIDDSDPHASALCDVLSDANLRQNVTDATNNRRNVLDLVITASSSSLVTGVSVDNLVTDHFAVICDLATIKPRPPRKTIMYC